MAEGSAAQRMSLQSRLGMRNAHPTRAVRIIEDGIDDPLAPRDIARDPCIATRHFERLFGKYLDTSQKRYVVDAASTARGT